MGSKWPLRTLVPLTVVAIFCAITGVSLLSAIDKREAKVVQDYQGRAQREVARLVTHAERFMHNDPLSLSEVIAQSATLPALRAVAITDPWGVILFSNESGWQELGLEERLPSAERPLLQQAFATRMAVSLLPDANSDRLVIMMSYNYPTAEGQLRSLERGVVYLAYDIHGEREEAWREALRERLPDLLALLLAMIGFMWLLRRLITTPLEQLAAGVAAVERGEFRSVVQSAAAQELCALTKAFNRMGARIKESVEELAEQAEHARTILDNVLDGIITINAEGTIHSFNSAAEQIFGYRMEEVVGRNVSMLMPEPYRSEHDGYLHNYLVTGVAHIIGATKEVTAQHKDGRYLHIELAVSEIRQHGQPLYIGMVRDITERKRAEAELREGKSRLNEAQRIAKVGSWTLNLRTNHLEWSDEIYRIFGIDKEQFGASYDAFLNAIHPEDREMVNKAYSDSLVNRLPYEIDHRLLMADGSVKYVQERCETDFAEDGTPLVSRGTVQDITLLKLTELARQEQALHTQAVLDNVLDGIITINNRGIVASFNLGAEKIFGYGAGEVIGQNVKMLMPEPYHDQHDTYLRNYLSTGVARIIGIGREVVGRRKDGSVFPMDLAVSEIQHQGAPLFIGMVRDITERKRMEKMKSEFVSTVSHELRTPLTSISGALGLLAGGALGSFSDQAKSLLDIAQKNSQRLTHLINDLLDMEKIAAGKLHFDMQLQPLMPLLEQALVANEPYARQYLVSYRLTHRADGVMVRVDVQRMMQVLANFLSNAAKFSPSGGAVGVDAVLRGELVRVSVRDHGSGIPEEFRTRIFQKFSQADSSDTRQKGGTGLGLAITKELVERMGGRVGFDSPPGGGTTFYFDLPVVVEGQQPMQVTAGADHHAPSLLVVEDDPDVAQLLGLMLQRAGYNTDIATNGESAIRALQEKRYAAVTLDLRLPDINGLELIRQLRNRPDTFDLPIIVVSAYMEEGRLAINGDFSTIDWLPKPIDEARLLQSVKMSIPGSGASMPRILHVEDDVDLHQVIKAMAGERFNFELATTLHQARELLALEQFDLVILDLTLPDGSGWELLPLLQSLQPEPRIVILSGTALTEEEAARVEQVFQKGRLSPRELLDTLAMRIAQTER